MTRQSTVPKRRILPAVVFATSLLAPTATSASPELPLDDPTYLKVYELQDRGLLPISITSAIRPITESEAQSLLMSGARSPNVWLLDPNERGFWIRPIERLASRWSLAHDTPRGYSTRARPRTMLGAVQLGCERQEGRPCGDGAIGLLELDSSAGFGNWLSVSSRIRTAAATTEQNTPLLGVDRLYANLELGPAELMVGRNVLVIGPGRHTQLLWGTNAPPLSRMSLNVRRLRIPGIPIAIGGGYTLGRLDAPQRFAGTLVSIARVHLEIADRLNLGMTNLLQLGGAGAPSVGFGQFIEEHVRRTGQWPGMGVSNRRLGYDLTLQLKPLRSTFYFEFVFEDWRAQFRGSLKYDTDYLVGWSTSGLGRGGRYGFILELHRTGVRSQEHGLFTSGMTSGGRAVGFPLGPDAMSLYVNPHWRATEAVRLSPWMEVIRAGSDSFDFPDFSAIVRTSSGIPELRWRAGIGALVGLRRDLWLDAGGFVEHVRNAEFRPATHDNFGATLAITWRR